MKLKKFNQLFEREGFDDIDGYDDEAYDYSREDEYKGEDEDDSEYDDDMSHLCYLLRSMFNNSNVDVNVENSGLDLSITAQFARRESLSDIVKVFEIVKKIKKDILAQYSILNMTTAYLTNTIWTEQNIHDRATALAEKAVEIWKLD